MIKTNKEESITINGNKHVLVPDFTGGDEPENPCDVCSMKMECARLQDMAEKENDVLCDWFGHGPNQHFVKAKPAAGATLTMNEYQSLALETAVYPDKYKVIYPALGLAGEAGEAADKVKKIIRDDNGVVSDEKKRAIALEIGDVLWYCATLANDLGYDLNTIAQMNYAKLKSRQERGKLQAPEMRGNQGGACAAPSLLTC